MSLAAEVDPHQTAPNPRVGCVVVKDGEIISQGAHQYCGQAHAEVLALSPDTVENQSGLEIYVTLEPCDHFAGKKTPSCTDLIIKANPRKIIVGALDPKFQGQNLEKIRQAGVAVDFADCSDCKSLNPFLEKYHSDSPYPYVCLKIAQSLDGKITSPDKYITNQVSRTKVHKLRAEYSALLTSTQTITQDNPQLNVRLKSSPGLTSDPVLIIVGQRDLSPGLKVFAGEKVQRFKTHDLKQVLRDLKTQGVDSVLVEVGQKLNTEFIAQNLADEIQIFMAPVFLGIAEKSTFSEMEDLENFRLTHKTDLKGDAWLRYIRKS